jgi:uncharacterized protein (DUF2147 family)
MRYVLFILTAMVLTATPVFGVAAGDSVFGIWLTEGGLSKLEITPCGDKACAHVVWLKHSTYMNSTDGPVGSEKIDRHNPDPSLRNRPVLGIQVMDGLTPEGDWWKNGNCYDPQSGSSYQCKMRLESSNELKIRGFVGFSLLGRSYTLTRDLSVAQKSSDNRAARGTSP